MSITVSNKDQELPPLLLPNLNFIKHKLSHFNINTGSGVTDPFLSSPSSSSSTTNDDHTNNNYPKRPLEANVNESGLDHLAFLATKRPKLLAKGTGDPMANNSNNDLDSNSPINIATITPPPTMPVSASISPSMHSNVPHMINTPPPRPNTALSQNQSQQHTLPQHLQPIPISSSSQNMYMKLDRKMKNQTIPLISLNFNSPVQNLMSINQNRRTASPLSTSSSPSPSLSASFSSNSNTTTKRQRVGPSCDKCRLKKIKCDAKIVILAQDEFIITLFSNKLHYVLTNDDILQNKSTLLKLNISKDTLETIINSNNDNIENTSPNNANNGQLFLVKHIDKLILFKQCLSCCKRKNASNNGINKKNACICLFSKGFTRADINVFSKISARVKNKTIYDIEISDYKESGF
ncbi:hypothetical protein KAFR_0C03230 [Kazachstania africana CBS 2517]|uniref:Zn(2)-C6 fungal-type domain-containing protein n=1 Tax=Kazachstania africana (strain ATCC 22294 / BCRC 22015 / CBS 2517 / CECT 1963 / NBRC 1671 / NRRL Y-8276) TaxID=1071382 RepID=H2ASG5_KAZAF|nr:hypothetical protein KAFR_0C03230 [Kazachstania africana CBS 2517]CCF57315.1 hypothetical protein KAFR_0C03230 [Kazachstania africana CBS 2517]